jgi:hypothetical protein
VAKDKIFYDIEKAAFPNIVAFKGTIRKCLNLVAVNIEGSMHPPICLFQTLFLVSVPVIKREFALTVSPKAH